MTESSLKFGPEWLRALSHGNTVASPPPSPSLPKYKLAEYRYGREEMLALFDKNGIIPPDLAKVEELVVETRLLPLALLGTTEEEQRTWARSVNSDAVLRLMGRGSERGNGTASTRGSRGGSSERGRGRGRGLYFQRGITSEEVTDGPSGGFSRPRPFERSQSMHERSQSWEDKEGRFDKAFTDSGRNFDTTWRRERDSEDGGWRTTSTRDRSNWRNCEKDDRDFDRDRGKDFVHSKETNDKSFSQTKSRKNKSWVNEHDGGGDQLPEWSIDDNGDVGFVGTFDSSGAFLENKFTDTHISGNEKDIVKNSTENKEHKNIKSKLKNNEENTNRKEREKETCSNGPAKELSSSVQIQRTSPPISDNFAGRTSCQPNVPVISERLSPLNTNASSVSETSNQNVSTKATPPVSVAVSHSVHPVTHSGLHSVYPNLHPEVTGHQLVHPPDPPVHQAAVAAVPPPPPPPQRRLPQSKLEEQELISQKPTNIVRNVKNDVIENDKGDDVNFDHLEKAAENLVAKWTAEEDEKAAQSAQSTALPMHHENALKWFYRDPQGQIQGPFTAHEMAEWFSAGYFTMNLYVRRGCDEKFCVLGELIKRWGRIPFLPGPSPPPLLNVPVNQTGLPAEQSVPQPLQEPERLFLLQQQLIQQHFIQQHIQQQLFIRHQAQLQQVLSSVKEQEGFNNLNFPQQQQILLQHLVNNQIQHLPSRPPGQDSVLSDLFLQLQRQPAANQPPVKEDTNHMWATLNANDIKVNSWNPDNKQQGNSVWDIDNTGGTTLIDESINILQELERKRKEDDGRAVEEEKQRQLQQQLLKEKEERKRQEDAKREEALRLKKEEELRKQQEEEMRKEKERKMLEEEQQRLLEEEQKRKEMERLEEERKRKEEERKRKEEERRKKEEKRRQEEEQKKKEAELELQRLKEAEKLKELQRQQELQRQEHQMQQELQIQQEFQRQQELQKELQKQEIQRQQIEALQKLQEKQKAEKAKIQIPAWGIQTNPTLSLTEIQKMQEEKEQEEREEQRRILQAQQQAVMQQQSASQQQKQNANLTWAQKPTTSGKPVKSLLEIQKEEAAEMAKQTKQVQQQQQQQQKQHNNISLLTAGVWGNASTHLTWNNTPTNNTSWSLDLGNNSVASGGGFWDEAMNASNIRKSSTRTEKSGDQQFPSLNKNAHTNNSSNKNKASRTKKEENNVLKIFESHTQKTDEFTQWCTEALNALQSSVDESVLISRFGHKKIQNGHQENLNDDFAQMSFLNRPIPTFVAFLKDVDSPYEVQEYVRSYLGENKETREFAKHFLERRSKYRNQGKVQNEENMWGPAPAINPIVNKPLSQQNVDSDCSKTGCKKKKKNRMQKVDSSILGFTVHASIDRINVGEIEHVEGM